MAKTQLPVAAAVRSVGICPAGPGDYAAVSAFVCGLSARSRLMRFFTAASPPSSAVLRGMCGAGRTTDALIATDGAVVVGHAMAADSGGPDGLLADVGLVVTDCWQRRGIGSALFGCLAARAAARGVRILAMDVMPENRRLLDVISRTWPDAAYQFAPDAVSIRVSLAGVAAAAGARRGGSRAA
jgi:GNAT superfamily N-acetyltransferase